MCLENKMNSVVMLLEIRENDKLDVGNNDFVMKDSESWSVCIGMFLFEFIGGMIFM